MQLRPAAPITRLLRSVAVVVSLVLVLVSCQLPDEELSLYWVRDTQLAVGGRVAKPTGISSTAMNLLVFGPNDIEAGLGMVSLVPAGTEVLGLTIDDGVATVDFSSEFEATGLGTAGELALVAQVVYTLTQFSEVDSVNITIEGQARDSILSHGLDATNLTRAGLSDSVLPGILVELPYPGQTVSSKIVISGQSRTFESTVVVEVTDAAGTVIGSGFTTASQPDVDKFGPFSLSVKLESGASGPATVTAFEESAEDGSRINVYSVPITIEP